MSKGFDSAKSANICAIIVITVLCQGIAIPIFIFGNDDAIGATIMIELGWLIGAISVICDLFRRCPVCGKRTLSRLTRCGGDRYTLYDGDCRNCGHDFDITRDHQEGETSYSVWDPKRGWEDITPIWEKDKDVINN